MPDGLTRRARCTRKERHLKRYLNSSSMSSDGRGRFGLYRGNREWGLPAVPQTIQVGADGLVGILVDDEYTICDENGD